MADSTKISRRFTKVSCPESAPRPPTTTAQRLPDFALSRDQLIAMKPAAIVAIVLGTSETNNF